MKTIPLFFCLLISHFLIAQTTIPKPIISISKKSNPVFEFSATKPHILCGAAAEEFFNYFWEFGDGNYAETAEQNIEHIYGKPGNYKVRCFVTPRYCAQGLGYPSDPFFGKSN